MTHLRVAIDYGELGDQLTSGTPMSEVNPYGPLLVSALERRGVEVVYNRRNDEAYLRANQGSIDVLHLHWPSYAYADQDRDESGRKMRAFVDRLRLARELGYHVVWTAHNVYPHDETHRDIDHEFRVELCRVATAVIAHCEIAAESVSRLFGRQKSLFVIPHGHFIEAYPARLTRTQARSSLGIPDNAYVYGVFGGIDRYKGVEEILSAFAVLSGQPWLVMSVASRGDYAKTIGRLVADRYPNRVKCRVFQPLVPGAEIVRTLAAADSCPFAFRSSTTSGSLVLALSWSRPVVAPSIGCLPTTVLPAAGIIYDPTQPKALVEALEAVRIIDPVASSSAALASVRRFDWDDIARRTIDAYRAEP